VPVAGDDEIGIAFNGGYEEFVIGVNRGQTPIYNY